jgi:hypothetical protein
MSTRSGLRDKTPSSDPQYSSTTSKRIHHHHTYSSKGVEGGDKSNPKLQKVDQGSGQKPVIPPVAPIEDHVVKFHINFGGRAVAIDSKDGGIDYAYYSSTNKGSSSLTKHSEVIQRYPSDTVLSVSHLTPVIAKALLNLDPPAEFDENQHTLFIPEPTGIFLDSTSNAVIYNHLHEIDKVQWRSDKTNITIGVIDKEATRPKPKPPVQTKTSSSSSKAKKSSVALDEILVRFHYGTRMYNEQFFFDPGKPPKGLSTLLQSVKLKLPLNRDGLVRAASKILHNHTSYRSYFDEKEHRLLLVTPDVANSRATKHSKEVFLRVAHPVEESFDVRHDIPTAEDGKASELGEEMEPTQAFTDGLDIIISRKDQKEVKGTFGGGDAADETPEAKLGRVAEHFANALVMSYKLKKIPFFMDGLSPNQSLNQEACETAYKELAHLVYEKSPLNKLLGTSVHGCVEHIRSHLKSIPRNEALAKELPKGILVNGCNNPSVTSPSGSHHPPAPHMTVLERLEALEETKPYLPVALYESKQAEILKDL